MFAISALLPAFALPTTGPGAALYATDAYPGFDSESEIVSPGRKEPRWFGFIFGPKMDSAAEQMAWCKSLEGERRFSKAIGEYDALVREWPFSPEAPEAQRRMADLLLDAGELEDAIAEYRYLLDFYRSQCDYSGVARLLFKCCEMWRDEGKRFVFFRFANTIDVRRAYEALVLRAPGETFAPAAMLVIAGLREDEDKLDEAVAVYGNLRNIHPGSEAAHEAVFREAAARLRLLEKKGYNVSRCKDTVSFLRQAVELNAADARAGELREMFERAKALYEEECWKAARFYDSPTRTKRSAYSALEGFVEEHPASPHVEEAKARMAELREEGQR